jgi:hypothetical protein
MVAGIGEDRRKQSGARILGQFSRQVTGFLGLLRPLGLRLVGRLPCIVLYRAAS